MTTGSPTAKFLLFAYLDERIEWPEMQSWADQLGIDTEEIIELQAACAMRRRSGLSALQPKPSSASVEDAAPALAFAYAHGWIGFDDVVRWGEDRQLDADNLLLTLEACARAGHDSDPSSSSKTDLGVSLPPSGRGGSVACG